MVSQGVVAADRVALVASLRDALARVALGAAVIYASFLLINLVRLSGLAGAAWIHAADVTSAGYALTLALVLRRRQPSLLATHLLGFVLVVLGTVNAELSAAITGDARELYYLSFFILGIGALALDARAALLAAAAIGGSALLVANRLTDRDGVTWVAACMGASTMLATAMWVARMRSVLRLDELRRRDEEQTRELARANERLQAELVERRRAEADRERAEAERHKLAQRQRELEDHVRRTQKLEALGTLAGGVAHDMNNVLGAIVAIAELGIEAEPPDSPARRDFGSILTAAQRGAAVTRNLLGFARRGKHRHEHFTLDAVVGEIVALLERTAPKRVRFVTELGVTGAGVMGDPGQFSHVVMNLCLNAVAAISGEGQVTLRLRHEELGPGAHAHLAPGRYVVLEIADDGAGMDAETLAHAFEPFFAGKSGRAGSSGLGLAMVYGTVRDHHGDVALASTLGRGTTVTVHVPAAVRAEAPAAAGAVAGQVTSPAAAGLVLVIDDEPMVRESIARLLEACDVRCALAAGGAQGVALFQRDPPAHAAVILDLAMPGMTGAECFEALRRVDPHVPVIIASGFPKDQSVERLVAAGRAVFLPKPFQLAELRAALSQVARRAPAAS